MRTDLDNQITLLRADNMIVVSPTPARVRSLLTRELSYTEKKHYRGAERRKRLNLGLSHFESVRWQCYDDDHKGRLATAFGFAERITAVLTQAGYSVTLRPVNKNQAEIERQRNETVYAPQWERIDALVEAGFTFRFRQKKCLKLMTQHECGRVNCPPGWGKSTAIMLACRLFPRAKIAVVTDRCAVLTQRLYPELSLNLPSVGIVGCGKRIKGRRVMCYSADSLHHASGDEDFVFVDEGHEACADEYAYRLARFQHARFWMFSASWDMRLDNKDMRAEALAGPIRLTVDYQESAERKIVVPIAVLWRDVIMDVNPAAGYDDVERKRYGVWANDYRNEMIARDARLYDDDTQVLITVETLEHALYLKQKLPEFTLVYSGTSIKSKQLQRFHRLGLIDADFRLMSPERKDRLAVRFTKGRLKKAIATPVWNVGVDFRHLQVLIRGEAGGSPIGDTQIPGRVSRTSLTDDKQVGIVHDYRDQFDRGFAQRARGRQKNYEQHGWQQHFVRKGRKRLLRELMGWEKCDGQETAADAADAAD